MEDLDTYIEQLKRMINIADVIGEDEPLQGFGGRFRRGQRHDSLVVDTEKASYHWNSQGEFGDVIAWSMARRGWDFKTAVEELARRVGMELPQWGRGDPEARKAAQQKREVMTIAARMMVLKLRNEPRALSYCEGRGWSRDSIRDAGLGYWDGDRPTLIGELRMHEIDAADPVARAVMEIPEDMLIYPHVERGRVVYLSCRSLEGKRHYNLMADLVGERQPYWNWIAIPGHGKKIVVVEGQADAVTLGQWGIPAVALAGVKAGDTASGRALLVQLSHHDTVYVGLDQDDAGALGAKALAGALGPQVRVVHWPDHDANDWLRFGNGDADNAMKLLEHAPMYIEVLASQVGELTNSTKQTALRHLFEQYARLDEFTRASLRSDLATAAGIKLREWDTMARAAAPSKSEGGAGGDDGPAITIESIGGMLGEYLVEVTYQPPEGAAGTTNRMGGTTAFAIRYPDLHIETQKVLDLDGIRYIPPSADSAILLEGVVRFAPHVGELLTTRELVRYVQHTIHKYVDIDVFYETLASYYVIFTWLYDAFNTLPYLRLLGDAGTGKSRFLQVVGAMCYRPLTVSGAATTSPIFRLLDRYRGTLIMDESDFGKSDEASDVVKIFNTGYQRAQGIVLRAGAKENGFDPEVFVVYGPKILAGRKRFEDWAVESRCLTKEMGGPTVRADIPIELPRSFWTEEIPAIQAACLRYRLEHWQPDMELDYTQLDQTIEPRLNQVMLSLVSIVDDADLQADLKDFMRKYNQQLIAERGMTLTAKVLEGVVVQWEMEKSKPAETQDLSLKAIAKRVNQLLDFENLEEDEERQGRDVSPKRTGDIARKQLQLATDRSGPNGRYAVTYNADRIEALKARYGLDEARLADLLTAVYEMEAREEDAKMARAQAAQKGFGGD